MVNAIHVDDIKKYWNERAKIFKHNLNATDNDKLAFDLECEKLLQVLRKSNIDNKRILEIGCGNGIKAAMITKEFTCEYVGIDYSENMINEAYQQQQKEVGT